MRKHADLDELILILEKEKVLLKKTIKEHLKEGDYRVASFVFFTDIIRNCS